MEATGLFYITGDTHGDFSRIFTFCKNNELEPQRDALIILGDAGINYSGDERDIFLKNQLVRLPITLFCIYGNHEMRPEGIASYAESTWNGGTIYVEAAFPIFCLPKMGKYMICAAARQSLLAARTVWISFTGSHEGFVGLKMSSHLKKLGQGWRTGLNQ